MRTSLDVLYARTLPAIYPSISPIHLFRASFHPITNRKHHCRLCGQIICSLPVKRPQRPVTCSLLFISDPKSGKIEEVSEGVDYGVRRRTVSSVGYGASRDSINPEEKFLRGVRICRVCRPALLWGMFHLLRRQGLILSLVQTQAVRAGQSTITDILKTL
jgi:hypothetical protein